MTFDPFDGKFHILIEYHFYICHDQKHDKCKSDILSLFITISNCIGNIWWIINMPWFFVSRYPNMIGGCKMMWNFFGSSHGKGLHDGAKVVVKRFFWK